jgi:hypothetical protein
LKTNDVLPTITTSAKLVLWGGLIICLALVLLWGQAAGEAKAQGGTVGKDVQALAGNPAGKLSYRLQLLAQPAVGIQDADSQAELLHLPARGPGSLLKNEAGEILVYIRLTDLSADTLQALTDAGASPVHIAPAYHTVTAYVGFDRLLTVADIPAVQSIQEELTPHVAGLGLQDEALARIAPAGPRAQADCGSAITSEGDTQLNAANARMAYGLDGTGVTVGILSDSYDNHSGAPATNAAADVASGDLPGVANPCGRTTPVNVIQEGLAGIDEGRAMLQIVHDLAPEANLAFASAFFGQFDFADQIRALRNSAGARVIADDIFYFSDPFFQDGVITQGIKDVTAAGTLYFTLAGNHHELVGGQPVGSYEAAAYRPMACPIIPEITQGDCHDFDPTAGADNGSSFTLANTGRLAVDLQWGEPWYGVQTDIDIYLLDNGNNILASSLDNNPGATQIPYEFFDYTNNTGGTQTVFLVIHRFDGTATPRLKYILLQSTFGLNSVEYNVLNSTDTFGPTVFGHSGANETVSVAAVRYNDGDTPEGFTSRGFPTYYFSPISGTTPAAPLPGPETRQKPDVGATDGGLNTFFGTASPPYRFFGTSAAAPHGAAVAALMTQQADQSGGTINQSLAETILETTALTMTSGSQEANGAGLINALDAANSDNFGGGFDYIYLPIINKT